MRKSSKPFIGITTSRRRDHLKRNENYLAGDYVKAIVRAGGLPVLIPCEYPIESIPSLVEKLDGLLLSGGGDIAPSLYNRVDDGWSANKSKDRDELEKGLVIHALEKDLPFLGICRGHQMLNAALGGTLYTDIASQYSTLIVHDQPKDCDPGALVHEVNIIDGSGLSSILNACKLRVNSRHHQAVNELAPGLVVTARASDGLIEGVEYPGKRFCVSVQWHPESLLIYPEHTSIFHAFIRASEG